MIKIEDGSKKNIDVKKRDLIDIRKIFKTPVRSYDPFSTVCRRGILTKSRQKKISKLIQALLLSFVSNLLDFGGCSCGPTWYITKGRGGSRVIRKKTKIHIKYQIIKNLTTKYL